MLLNLLRGYMAWIALAGHAANPICSKPWAYPIAALALIPVILREGWEAVHSSILGCQCSPNSVCEQLSTIWSRVPAVYLSCANPVFLAFFAFNRINNLPRINGAPNSDSPAALASENRDSSGLATSSQACSRPYLLSTPST